MSILITKHMLDLFDLYDMRDDIGLSRKECELTSTCGDLRKAKAYRDRRVMRMVDGPIPRIELTVYVWVPANDHDKAVILDGRKRLMDVLSCVDDTYSLNEGDCSLDLKAQLHATKNLLSETLLLMSVNAVVIASASYWEAALEVYPEICERRTETAEREQQMLQELLVNRDAIFTDKEKCAQRLAELNPRLRFPNAYSRVLISDEAEDNETVVRRREDVMWKNRAFEFVARHHARGVVPC